MASIPPKNPLTISLSKHPTGRAIADVLAKDWFEAPDSASKHNNVGFDVGYHKFEKNLADIGKTLNVIDWSGVLIGW